MRIPGGDDLFLDHQENGLGANSGQPVVDQGTDLLLVVIGSVGPGADEHVTAIIKSYVGGEGFPDFPVNIIIRPSGVAVFDGPRSVEGGHTHTGGDGIRNARLGIVGGALGIVTGRRVVVFGEDDLAAAIQLGGDDEQIRFVILEGVREQDVFPHVVANSPGREKTRSCEGGGEQKPQNSGKFGKGAVIPFDSGFFEGFAEAKDIPVAQGRDFPFHILCVDGDDFFRLQARSQVESDQGACAGTDISGNERIGIWGGVIVRKMKPQILKSTGHSQMPSTGLDHSSR